MRCEQQTGVVVSPFVYLLIYVHPDLASEMSPSRPISIYPAGTELDNVTTFRRTDYTQADEGRTQLDVIVVVLVLLITILVVMLVCKVMQNKRKSGCFAERKDYFSEEHNHRMLIIYSSVKVDKGHAAIGNQNQPPISRSRRVSRDRSEAEWKPRDCEN